MERKKDVYYEFIEEYPKMLPDEEMKIFKQHFPTFKVLRQSMWRWQKEVLPRAPLTQKDLDEKLEYFFSDKGKHLVLGDEIDENEKRIMTFGNPEDLIYFKESKRLNIDTTFKSAAQPNWASVLILQARVEDCWAPLVYTLLPAEDEDTFKKAFSQIRKAVEKQGKGFRYESEVMFDFDETLRNAYKRTIGNDYRHRCRGCSFHFGKCIMDYVNGKRMMTKYQDKENTELNDTIKAALGEKVNITIRGGIKKNCFFSEKLRKGGRGVSPNPKFPYQKKLRFFWNFFYKGGGVSPIPKGCYHKKLGICGYYRQKVGLNQSKRKTENISEFFAKSKISLSEKLGPPNCWKGGSQNFGVFRKKYSFFLCLPLAAMVSE